MIRSCCSLSTRTLHHDDVNNWTDMTTKIPGKKCREDDERAEALKTTSGLLDSHVISVHAKPILFSALRKYHDTRRYLIQLEQCSFAS